MFSYMPIAVFYRLLLLHGSRIQAVYNKFLHQQIYDNTRHQNDEKSCIKFSHITAIH